MSTLAAVMAELKKKGSEQTRKTYERHDPGTKNMFGVKVADLKVIVKKIKGQQALACELFATGNYDAMYLAGLVANGKEMTARQLDEWVEGASRMRIIAEYSVPFVTVENPDARKIALRWMKSKQRADCSGGLGHLCGSAGAYRRQRAGSERNSIVAGNDREEHSLCAQSSEDDDEQICDCRGKLRETTFRSSEGGSDENRRA